MNEMYKKEFMKPDLFEESIQDQGLRHSDGLRDPF